MVTLYIKNMVCPRCITAVEELFKEMQCEVLSIKLGVVTVNGDCDFSHVAKRLAAKGFELLRDPIETRVSQIKAVLITLCNENKAPKNTLSFILEGNFKLPYHTLSKEFRMLEGQTIEHYWMKLRMEKAKELLSYNQLRNVEIARLVGYSGLQSFGKAFKKYCCTSPNSYKADQKMERKTLDSL